MNNNNLTPGTWAAIAINCIIAVVGVLQGVDWVHLIGSSTGGWVAAVICAINAGAHYMTGGQPLALRHRRAPN